MTSLIIGNAFSLLAMLSDGFSSSRKTAKGVLLVQILSQIFYGTSTIVLGGYSAAVQNVVSILRNLLAIRETNNKILEWVLVLLGVGFGIVFNNLGFVGWLPIIANLEYSLVVFYCKDNHRALKAAFLVTVALFFFFNIVIMNIVGVVSNVVLFVMTAIFLIRDIRQEKSQ